MSASQNLAVNACSAFLASPELRVEVIDAQTEKALLKECLFSRLIDQDSELSCFALPFGFAVFAVVKHYCNGLIESVALTRYNPCK